MPSFGAIKSLQSRCGCDRATAKRALEDHADDVDAAAAALGEQGGAGGTATASTSAAAAAAEDEQLKPVWSSGVPFYPPSSRYWRIGGEWYDLEPFLDKHPGTLVPVLDLAAG